MLHAWSCIFWNVEGVHATGEAGRVVVDVADRDVHRHVRGLLPVVGPHQQRVLGSLLAVQALGGDQLARLGVDAEAVVGAADDGVRHQSIGTLGVGTQACVATP